MRPGSIHPPRSRVDDDGTWRRRVRFPGRCAVGNGAGFWGDNLDAPYLLARDGRLDVLTLEYLAELTMAILSHLRSKDPSAGYVTDFPELVERLVPHPARISRGCGSSPTPAG